MDVFSRIIASRLFAWMTLITPGVVLLVIPTLNGELGIDPLKELFHRSGEIAVWTLGAVLCLSPLRTLFPRSKIVNACRIGYTITLRPEINYWLKRPPVSFTWS